MSDPAIPPGDPPPDYDLIARVRAGDKDAEQQLYDAFVGRLVAHARHHLSQRLASRVDPEDIVQSVFGTFFKRVQQGQFRIEAESDLFKLLMKMTLNKTLKQVNFQRADKRDPARECHVDDADREHQLQLLTREPSPEVTVAFLDELEAFQRKLRPDDRRILELRLSGYSTEEIAQRMTTPQRQVYDRKVRRVLEHIAALAKKEGLAAG